MVIAGLVPAIQGERTFPPGLDARDKRGHDMDRLWDKAGRHLT
jgi:hypothetical protein